MKNETYPANFPGWMLLDRGDGRIEIVCPHGVGHPNELVSRLIYGDAVPWKDWMAVHGCDGCCQSQTFKDIEGDELS